MVHYIGITGFAGAGKDTLANVLCAALEAANIPNLSIERIAFADALKAEVSEKTGISAHKFYDRAEKEIYRPLLQWWGTEYRRNPLCGGYDNYWIDTLQKICDLRAVSSGTNMLVIVPDVRFDNEARFCKENNGMVIKVIAVNQEKIVVNPHVSENGVSSDYIDKIHVNDHKKPLLVDDIADILAMISDVIKVPIPVST